MDFFSKTKYLLFSRTFQNLSIIYIINRKVHHDKWWWWWYELGVFLGLFFLNILWCLVHTYIYFLPSTFFYNFIPRINTSFSVCFGWAFSQCLNIFFIVICFLLSAIYSCFVCFNRLYNLFEIYMYGGEGMFKNSYDKLRIISHFGWWENK